MKRLAPKLLLIAVAIVGYIAPAMAQSEEEDYYLYKFYDEDEELYNAALFDSYPHSGSSLSYAGAIADISALAEAGMRSVMNNPRGASRNEERYMVGQLNINYTSSSALMLAGIRRERHPGISYARISGATAPTTTFDLGHKSQRSEAGHSLRAEFSGRNHLVGITQSSVYRLSKGNVARHSDWLFAHGARIRAGRDIYVGGVHNNAVDLSLYASRSWENNTLHLAAFLPWSERASRRASLSEAFALTNNPMYNPAWGYHKGKVRNANIATSLRPEALVAWHHEFGDNSLLSLVGNLSYENSSFTKLSSINAASPLPDNYRSLPSAIEDEALRNEVTNAWINNDTRLTQIDWDRLYETNLAQKGGHAAYLVDNSHTNTLRSALSANMQHRIAGITIDAGVILDHTTAHEFMSVDDLLGGSHILNIDYTNYDASTDATPPYNNLREGDHRVHEGDHYAYDYRLSRLRSELYSTLELKFGRTSLAASIHIGWELTTRRGYYEKSLFPGKGSYGKSQSVGTLPYRLNLAWYYHMGRHSLSASAMYRAQSPEVKDILLQPRYNNRIAANPHTEKSFSLEASYNYIGERVSLVTTTYLTTHSNRTNIVRYYDDMAMCMADGVVRNIATISAGIEASAKIHWARRLSSTLMLTASQHRYTRNADVEVLSDADNRLIANSTSQVKGLHTSTPELTLYGDVEYRPAKGWLLRIAGRYWGFRYAEPSLIRRSEHLLSLTLSDEERSAALHQERLDDVAMVDLVASKSFRFSNGMRLMVQFAANNLLGSKAIYRSYEQNRVLTTTNESHTHIAPFANMVQYAYPRTFRVMLSLWF